MLGSFVLGFGIAIWRGAADLHGHVRAGSLAVVEALTAYARGGSYGEGAAMAEVHRLMPGLGAPTALQLGNADFGASRSLSELNLRGHTGATVLAILRDGEAIVAPSGTERLRGGDVLALAGTRDAIDAAREVLLRKDIQADTPTS